jgi:hypothetical protein
MDPNPCSDDLRLERVIFLVDALTTAGITSLSLAEVAAVSSDILVPMLFDLQNDTVFVHYSYAIFIKQVIFGR